MEGVYQNFITVASSLKDFSFFHIRKIPENILGVKIISF